LTFIVLDGINEEVINSQLMFLDDWLQKKDQTVYVTYEPSPLPTGDALRKLLERKDIANPYTLAHLSIADRYDHTHVIIYPNLLNFNFLLCQHYIAQTVAYYGPFINPDHLMDLQDFLPIPHATIIIDSPIESMAEIHKRRGEAYMEKVRQLYIKYGNLENCHIIDGEDKPNDIHKNIIKIVADNIEEE
jgi:thymidylate kinase